MSKKVIIVTGASSGFGKDAVKELLNRGHVVYAAARRVSAMEDIKKEGAKILSLDVTNDDQVEAAIKEVIKNEKRIDVLVNNAGYGGYGMVESVSIEEAHKQFEVNVFGVARMMRAVLPYMRKQKSGTIINMSSVVGKVSSPMIGWYSASKHSVEALSNAVRAEVKSLGIKIAVIEPGAMNTGFLDVALKQIKTVKNAPEYQANADAFLKTFKKNYANAPGPEKVVKTIVKIAESNNPKTRYAVGTDSKAAIFMTKIFSDKMMDNIFRSMYGMK